MKHFYAIIETYCAPSSNYRGQSVGDNRVVLQTVKHLGRPHAIISAPAIRNAIRELMILEGLPYNRERIHDEDQLAVKFQVYPDPGQFADDFVLGYLVTDKKAVAEMKTRGVPFRRVSVLQLNVAQALLPFEGEALMHQSPSHTKDTSWRNQNGSVLFEVEVSNTSFQCPLAFNVRDFEGKESWGRAVLKILGELSNVAGGHSRHYFPMHPRSLVVRVSSARAPGYDPYGFAQVGDRVVFPELSRLNPDDLPGHEFFVGGQIVREMDPEERTRLENEGVCLFANPQRLLAKVADELFPVNV